jgi:hypothetical protein
MAQELLRVLGAISDRRLGRIDLERLDIDVDVIVYQTRHQSLISAVDAISSVDFDGSGGDLFDLIALYKHEERLCGAGTAAVEQCRVFKNSA